MTSARRHINFDVALSYITAAPAPVVLLDTCAVLDVIRAPLLKHQHVIVAATTLVRRAAATPVGAWLVVTAGVVSEWAERETQVRGQIDDRIRFVDNTCVPLDRTLRLLDPQAPGRALYESYAIGDQLHGLASVFGKLKPAHVEPRRQT